MVLDYNYNIKRVFVQKVLPYLLVLSFLSKIRPSKRHCIIKLHIWIKTSRGFLNTADGALCLWTLCGYELHPGLFSFLSQIKINLHNHYLNILILGMVCGVFTFGVLSDMFGRRRVLIPILLAMSATGILTALMPNYVTFIIARQVKSLIRKFS